MLSSIVTSRQGKYHAPVLCAQEVTEPLALYKFDLATMLTRRVAQQVISYLSGQNKLNRFLRNLLCRHDVPLPCPLRCYDSQPDLTMCSMIPKGSMVPASGKNQPSGTADTLSDDLDNADSHGEDWTGRIMEQAELV